jgi:hypothetical protein
MLCFEVDGFIVGINVGFGRYVGFVEGFDNSDLDVVGFVD